MAACKSATVITTAKKYDGYLEKATNAKLNDFKANAGSNNWTRFGRDYDAIMGTKLNGQSWCAMYISMMFVEAYGLKAAKKLLGGNLFSYTPTGATRMKAKKGVKPKPGDVVFFYSSSMGRISHVGLVIAVDRSRFYTIEGNTSSDPGVVRNGGSVNQKSYSINFANAYFATPPYASVTSGADAKPAISVVVSSDVDAKNPYKAPKETIKKGSKGESVKWIQWELNQWKSSLKLDGDFGSNTEAQVKAFQKAKKLAVDGIVGAKTIAALKKD